MLVAAMLAVPAVAQTGTLPKTLDARIDGLASRAPKHRVGICVREIPSGKIVYQRLATTPYELASNTKLLTTAAALDTLGQGYGFVTRLYARGSVDYFGNLDGDIVIAGSGEPGLTGGLRTGSLDGVVAQWASAIREKGIRSVMGNIVVDTSLSDAADNRLGGDYAEEAEGGDEGDGEDDEEMDEDDEEWVPTEALLLLVTPGPAAGKRATLSVRPAGTTLKVLNSCFTVPGPTRQVKVTRGRDGVIVVGGKVGMSAGTVTHILAYGDPGLQAASLLRETLPRSGVPVLGDVTVTRLGAAPAEATMLTESKAELTATLHLVNKYSHNQTAEEILRVMGGSSPAAGSLSPHAAGCKVVKTFLERQGLAPASFSVADGSGLSHANRMSPESLSKLLVAMSGSEHASLYKSSLAIPGEDGTLRGRLSAATRYGRIAAKTGHISGVNTLSGYLDTKNGSYAFSLLTNGKPRVDNGFVDALTTQLASALAVSDGSIPESAAAPAPTWSKPKHGKKSKKSKGKASKGKSSSRKKSRRK